MERFIGKKVPKAPPPTLADSAKTLEGRSDNLDQRIAKLDKELFEFKKQLKTAKGSAAANIKQRAMGVLKRKKMLEKQRDNVAQQAFNLDQTAFTLETLKTTKDTVQAMKAGAKAMKKELKHIDISEIEDIQDDLADQMEDFEELNLAMSREWGLPNDIDETDLDAELEGLDDETFELEQEETTEEPDYLKAPDIPSAPNTKLVSTEAPSREAEAS